MGFLRYIAQIWHEATYDITPTWCTLRLDSEYSYISWHCWLMMMVPWKDEVGVLETSKMTCKRIGWLQDILSVWGTMGCLIFIAQVFFKVIKRL